MAGEIVHFEVPAMDTEGSKFSLWQSDPNAA